MRRVRLWPAIDAILGVRHLVDEIITTLYREREIVRVQIKDVYWYRALHHQLYRYRHRVQSAWYMLHKVRAVALLRHDLVLVGQCSTPVP